MLVYDITGASKYPGNKRGAENTDMQTRFLSLKDAT